MQLFWLKVGEEEHNPFDLFSVSEVASLVPKGSLRQQENKHV